MCRSPTTISLCVGSHDPLSFTYLALLLDPGLERAVKPRCFLCVPPLSGRQQNEPRLIRGSCRNCIIVL